MTKEEKIRLVDSLLSNIKQSLNSNDYPVLIGTLNKRQGINGFEVAEVGHPVFEYKDRYIIYLESQHPLVEKVHGKELTVEKYTIKVPYYKETLTPLIDFISSKSSHTPPQ